jgi:hypothetical protein
MNPFGHLQGRLGGLFTAVAHLAARSLPRLLFTQGGDEPEGCWHAGGKRYLSDARCGLARNVLEVGGLASDDDAHAHDPCVPAGRRQVARGLRELEGSRHPMHLDGVGTEAGGPERLERTGDEPLGDALVEAGCDDREPE